LKLDLNKLAQKLAEIPLRISDDQIQKSKTSSQPRSRRIRSKGIS